MTDLISRQEAIDMFQNLSYDNWNQIVVTTWANAYREAADKIECLPSAQPDRSLWFRIGEICVDESKGFISADRAVEKIRELLRKAERGWEE